MALDPFWEKIYLDDSASSAFGEVAPEVHEVGLGLPARSRVLDLGSGDGRNSIALAVLGHEVLAVDISTSAISKLKQRAISQNVVVHTTQVDLADFAFEGQYELIVAHGCLHLLHPPIRDRVLQQMQRHTANGGYNVVVVFTDTLEPPEDLRPWTVGLFREGEIFQAYEGWLLTHRESYVLSDEHPGGVRHEHAINKVVAQKQ